MGGGTPYRQDGGGRNPPPVGLRGVPHRLGGACMRGVTMAGTTSPLSRGDRFRIPATPLLADPRVTFRFQKTSPSLSPITPITAFYPLLEKGGVNLATRPRIWPHGLKSIWGFGPPKKTKLNKKTFQRLGIRWPILAISVAPPRGVWSSKRHSPSDTQTSQSQSQSVTPPAPGHQVNPWS